VTNLTTATLVVGEIIAPNAAAQPRQDNACAVFTLDELIKVTGRTSLRPGRSEQVPTGGTTCTYHSHVGGVVIGLGPTTKSQFDEFRELAGPEAEVVTGIGDEAFFLGGPDFIHIRVATTNLTVRVNGDQSPALRTVVLNLAKAGVAKLR